MITESGLTIRSANLGDRNQLANLIHFEVNVHRHLEWRPPLDWIGAEPYRVIEDHGKLMAALACQPDPEQVAWVRLFVSAFSLSLEQAWGLMWPEARQQLVAMENVKIAAALPLHPWFETILIDNGFQQVDQVVMLAWERQEFYGHIAQLPCIIRPMKNNDLPTVHTIDTAAFDLIWQNSQKSLELAFKQAIIATVAEAHGKIIGYQISTPTPLGGHLARLAVLPEFQGQGIGHALVQDALKEFVQRGAQRVTVNTQKGNLTSLSVYKKEGFLPTGEEYPIYQLKL